MNISPVTQTNAATFASSATVTPANDKVVQSKPQTTISDTVHISCTAKAIMEEAQETSAQTAQEANKGDMQAHRKMEREEATESPAAMAQEALKY